MADNKDRPIIIKRIKKAAAGAHGGSWKVAYADFVTAMMAFFLLMWLLATASSAQRTAIEYYFKNYSVFDAGSGVMPVISAPKKTNSEEASEQQKAPSGKEMSTKRGQEEKNNVEEKKEATQKQLQKMIDLKLSEFKDQIQVEMTPEGVRINVMDKDGQPMFLSGAAQFQPWSAQVMKTLAEEINRLPNPVVIEGHTDATPYAGNSQITNWELSTQRAMAARRALEYYSVDRSRFAKIVGHADKELLYKDAPTDPRNRRISFVLQFENASKDNMKAIDLLSTDDQKK